jgi:hypothetical protein
MIISRNYVSRNDFGDCHDEIAVADVDFIGGRQFMAFMCKERGASGDPTSIMTSDHRSHH